MLSIEKLVTSFLNQLTLKGINKHDRYQHKKSFGIIEGPSENPSESGSGIINLKKIEKTQQITYYLISPIDVI
jgi:hypothetical protein